MKPKQSSFVLRHVPRQATPQIAVVQLDDDGGGEELAWFFSAKLAREYIRLKSFAKGKK